MWSQVAQRGSPVSQTRNTLALVFNHLGSGMRSSGLIFSVTISLVLPLSQALCCFPLCLPGSWWERLEWGCCVLSWRRGNVWSLVHLESFLEADAAAGDPSSLRYWDGFDYFLSGQMLYFSYWTFPCKLKWEKSFSGQTSSSDNKKCPLLGSLTVSALVSQCLDKTKPLEGNGSPSPDLNWFLCSFCFF